jgi:PmbA protein
MGLHTVDTVSGDFSLGIKGALIRCGHPAEPVAGVTMAGSILDLLAGVKALGKELRFFGTTGGSALAVDDMAIAGL